MVCPRVCAILLLPLALILPGRAVDFQAAKIRSAFTALDGGSATVEFALADGSLVNIVRVGPMFRPGRIAVVTKGEKPVTTELTKAEAETLIPILAVRLQRTLPENAQRLPIAQVPEKLKVDWWVYRSMDLLHSGMLKYQPPPTALVETP